MANIYFTLEAQARAQGREAEVSFFIHEDFAVTVTTAAIDYLTGEIVGNYTVIEIMQEAIDDYCNRYSLDIDSVVIDKYIVTSNAPDSVVYFNPSNPTIETTNDTDFIYAYLIVDVAAPLPLVNVSIATDEFSATISWETLGHVHGFKIYDEDDVLLITLNSGTLEWTDYPLESDTLYTYKLTAYNLFGENTPLIISARTTVNEVEIITPPTPPAYVSTFVPITDVEDTTMHGFQSGYGDNLDLKVNLSKDRTSREVFSYNMQIKGYQTRNINIYPQRELRYRLNAIGTASAVPFNLTTPWYIGVVDGLPHLNVDGGGRQDLRVPITMELPDLATGITYTVEFQDPFNYISMAFDKGIAPTTTFTDDTVIFFSKPTSAQTLNIKDLWYGPKVDGKGFFTVKPGERVILQDDIPAPFYDPTLVGHTIEQWVTLVNSDNPNVRLQVALEPVDFMENKKFLQVKLAATIINATQTPWNPAIHNGYYYLNQAEMYLYSESKVRGRVIGSTEYVPVTFTYAIDLTAVQTTPGQDQTWLDQYSIHYLGAFTNTSITRYPNKLSLIEGASSGSYISEAKVLGNTATSYLPTVWSSITTDGSSLSVYSSSLDIDGITWSVWIPEVNGENFKSPLSKQIRYKIEMTSGSALINDTVTLNDKVKANFDLGISQNTNIALTENVATTSEYVQLADTETATGIFTSQVIDLGTSIDALQPINYKFILPAGIGSAVAVYTASSNTDAGWSTATWNAVTSPVVQSDGSISATIASTTRRYMKYQVRFTRSTHPVNTTTVLTSDTDFTAGVNNNTQIFNQGVTLVNLNLTGFYISPIIDHGHVDSWTSFTPVIAPAGSGGSITYKTLSSDDLVYLTAADETNPSWLALSGGAIASSPSRYIRWMATFTSGYTDETLTIKQSPKIQDVTIVAAAHEYLSPKLDEVTLTANVHHTDIISPLLSSISIGGHYANIVTNETYSKNILTNVASDQLIHAISTKTIYDTVEDFLNEQGVSRTGLVYSKYEIKTLDTGIVLSSRNITDTTIIYAPDDPDLDLGHVFAQTTSILEETIFDQVRINVDLDNTAVMTPIPQQGSPIVVNDSDGNELTQVVFYDDADELTLFHTEEFISDERREFLLAYPDIDSATLVVEKLVGTTWTAITGASLDDTLLTLPTNYPIGTTTRARYCILDSYFINYNYDTISDFAKITLHNPTLDSTREIKISYETNKESSYYISTEIDLNPMKNIQNAGFIYLSNTVQEAYKMQLHVNPKIMYSNGHDLTIISATLIDRLGNPVVDANITFTASNGTINLLQGTTDVNGIALAKFTTSITPGPVTITATLNASIHAVQIIETYPELISARLSVLADDYTLTPNGTEQITIRAHVLGENQEPLINTAVTFTASAGIITTSPVNTNYFGEAKVKLKSSTSPSSGIIRVHVQVPSLGLEEYINIRVNGVSILV
jgi:hypothetical protein